MAFLCLLMIVSLIGTISLLFLDFKLFAISKIFSLDPFSDSISLENAPGKNSPHCFLMSNLFILRDAGITAPIVVQKIAERYTSNQELLDKAIKKEFQNMAYNLVEIFEISHIAEKVLRRIFERKSRKSLDSFLLNF